ncbi:MAG: hypothetical protein Ta2E_11860 [Mycoplasmoidaceae bacterium]|nr:MAG: hypothetical protein Ta2E_11860 [Mycoplasmoidaceae bacterium]
MEKLKGKVTRKIKCSTKTYRIKCNGDKWWKLVEKENKDHAEEKKLRRDRETVGKDKMVELEKMKFSSRKERKGVHVEKAIGEEELLRQLISFEGSLNWNINYDDLNRVKTCKSKGKIGKNMEDEEKNMEVSVEIPGTVQNTQQTGVGPVQQKTFETLLEGKPRKCSKYENLSTECGTIIEENKNKSDCRIVEGIKEEHVEFIQKIADKMKEGNEAYTRENVAKKEFHGIKKEEMKEWKKVKISNTDAEKAIWNSITKQTMEWKREYDGEEGKLIWCSRSNIHSRVSTAWVI